jgi:hypothetical protein
MLISSCDRTGKKVFMPDGNIYSNPTIKTLQESGYSVLFLPYSGYSIPTFKDTLFANSYLLLEGDNYYFGESELSEETKVKGFATIVNRPESSMENIVEALINEPSIQNKVLDTKITSKDKAQIILNENLMLEIEKEKGMIFCKTRKH